MGCNPNAQGHPIIRASMYSYFWLSGEYMKQMFLLAIDQMINVMADYSLWASGSSCCFLPGISDSRSRGLQIVCSFFSVFAM